MRALCMVFVSLMCWLLYGCGPDVRNLVSISQPSEVFVPYSTSKTWEFTVYNNSTYKIIGVDIQILYGGEEYRADTGAAVIGGLAPGQSVTEQCGRDGVEWNYCGIGEVIVQFTDTNGKMREAKTDIY